MTIDAPLRSHAWARATGGALTRRQRLHCTAASLSTFAQHGAQLARLATGVGRPEGTPDEWLPAAPDPALSDAALAVARDQGPEIEGHGLRTWLFGAMLAAGDGVDVDHDLLHVAGVCHDAGAARVVEGEDFTLRSAELAVAAFERAGRPLDERAATLLRDGIVAHATPGLDRERDTLGAYVQDGAMLDLVGLRLVHLPAAVVEEVYRRHPQDGVREAIARAVRAEARAVPRGRFALLRRLGLLLAMRVAPNRDL